MEDRRYIALVDRGVLAVSGPDARSYPQAVVSNDMNKVPQARASYATLPPPPLRGHASTLPTGSGLNAQTSCHPGTLRPRLNGSKG